MSEEVSLYIYRSPKYENHSLGDPPVFETTISQILGQRQSVNLAQIHLRDYSTHGPGGPMLGDLIMFVHDFRSEKKLSILLHQISSLREIPIRDALEPSALTEDVVICLIATKDRLIKIQVPITRQSYSNGLSKPWAIDIDPVTRAIFEAAERAMISLRKEPENPNRQNDNAALQLSIDLPDEASDETISEVARETVRQLDEMHRALGGGGLKIERIEVTEDAKLLTHC